MDRHWAWQKVTFAQLENECKIASLQMPSLTICFDGFRQFVKNKIPLCLVASLQCTNVYLPPLCNIPKIPTSKFTNRERTYPDVLHTHVDNVSVEVGSVGSQDSLVAVAQLYHFLQLTLTVLASRCLCPVTGCGPASALKHRSTSAWTHFYCQNLRSLENNYMWDTKTSNKKSF